MKQFLVQYIKDFKANFYNFNPYIILGGYCLLSFFSALYLGDYFLRESNILNSYFSLQPIILMLIIPAITMRSWADEIKSGTLELLLTLPISYFKLTFAKFMAALSFFFIMMLCSLPFFFLTNKFAILDINVVGLAYIGMFLCGALFTAIGCLVSAFNRNIILCYITTIFTIFFAMHFNMDSITLGGINISLRCLAFEDNYTAFLLGVINWSNILYFILFIIFLLWLNTLAIKYRKIDIFLYKKHYLSLAVLLMVIFSFSVIGATFNFKHSFDLTDDHKFTLSQASKDILAKLDKRIDVTLYESKVKREDANSSYAVYADYVEKILKLIELDSEGLVRTEIVRVEPFSSQERHIINNNTPYEDDNLGYKVYMTAEFSDNEGHHFNINAFPNLRQNLLESDIMRGIERFGLNKKNIAFISTDKDLQNMPAFNGILKEFYNVSYLNNLPNFIAPSYDAAIFVNPMYLSSETLLAMEQYVLNGGNLIIFYEPTIATKQDIAILNDFMKTFGITLNDNEDLLKKLYTDSANMIVPTTLAPSEYWQNIRSVIVDSAGNIDFASDKEYKVYPILYSDNMPVAAVSIGKFVSNYLNLAAESENIIPLSKTTGKVLFFYDSDLLKNYLMTSEESKGNSFYEIIPTSDNMLFLLNLLDFATQENIEKHLSYRHFALNHSSIGHAILSSIKSRYAAKMNEIKAQLSDYQKQQQELKNIITGQGYASAKNFENIGSIAQNIDEKKDELNKFNALILNDYQFIVLAVSALLIFIIPALILLLMAVILYIIRRMNLKKIGRIVEDA